MEIQTCPSCSGAIPSRAIYCPLCTKQIRCRNCHELLEANWRACIQCGVMIGESATPVLEQEPTADTQAVNIIEYHETQRKRSLKAQFTNTIGNSLTKTLNLILANKLIPDRVRERRTIQGDTEANDGSQPLLPFRHSKQEDGVPPENTLDQHEKGELNTSDSLGSQADLESLKKLFSQDGDKFILLDDRLKASSKIDFVRRLTCLFLYFRKLEGHDKVLRSTLSTLVKSTLWKKVSASDGNTRQWLAKNNDTVHFDEGYIGLSNPGQDYAAEVLNEMRDEHRNEPLKEGQKKNSHSSSVPMRLKKRVPAREEKGDETKPRLGNLSGRPGPSGL